MLTRYIYPLNLRQSISSRLRNYYKPHSDKNVPLSFNPSVRLDLHWQDVAHQSIIMNGFYELALTRKLSALAQKGGLLVDVGANYGYFACLWASLHPANRVLALEPSPSNFAALTHNIRKNQLEHRIDAMCMAAGRQQGILKFATHTERGQTGWGGLTHAQKGNLIDVQVQTLDTLVQENHMQKIDVLKVDTEGADTWVLLGAENLIKAKAISHIFFEHNTSRMQELGIGLMEAETFLRSHGYAVEKISHNEFHAFPLT